MPSSEKFSLAIVYDSGKRYIIPIDAFNGVISDEQLKKIKQIIKREVQKL